MESPASTSAEARRREPRKYPWLTVFLLHEREISNEHPTCRQFIVSKYGQLVLFLMLCLFFMALGLLLATIASTTARVGSILIGIALGLELSLAVAILFYFFTPRRSMFPPPPLPDPARRQERQEGSHSHAELAKLDGALLLFCDTISGQACFSLLADAPAVIVGLKLIALGVSRMAGIALVVACIVDKLVLIATILVHRFPPACLRPSPCHEEARPRGSE